MPPTTFSLFFRSRYRSLRSFLVKKTYVNVPMLSFVVLGIGPYGMTLNFRHLSVNPLLNKVRVQDQGANSTNQTTEISSCPQVSYDVS